MILLFVACSRRKTSRPEEPPARYKELQTLLPGYAKRLKKKGVTRQQLFQEYRSSHPDGYARSRFCNYFQAYLALSHPVAHLEHKAGDKMFIDHAGDKLALVDRDTGQTIPVEVFVSILPCSQLTYVEAVMSQRKEDLIHACESALLFYGGTPAVIVPDNLKSAVNKPSRYEAELNEDFAAFAEHYGCVVIPARVRKPRDRHSWRERSSSFTGVFTLVLKAACFMTWNLSMPRSAWHSSYTTIAC